MTKYALIDMDPGTRYGTIASIHDDVRHMAPTLSAADVARWEQACGVQS